MKHLEFKPKLFTALQNYSKKASWPDLMGRNYRRYCCFTWLSHLVSLGSFPRKGIITAIVAGFIISLLGRKQSTDRRTYRAFIIIIYGIVRIRRHQRINMQLFMAEYSLFLSLYSSWSCYQIHSLSHYCRIYQWYCPFTILRHRLPTVFGLRLRRRKSTGETSWVNG